MYDVDSQDRVTDLLGLPQWSTGAPLPGVVAAELDVLLAYRLQERDPDWDGTYATMLSPDSEDQPFAIVRFRLAKAHMFGPPNDEAFEGHPLYSRGLRPYSAAEVTSSSWIRRLERMNAVHPQHRPEHFSRYRHFILAFHDSTFECVAQGFEVTISRGSMTSAYLELARRLADSAA